jgi:hypothetical protein
MSRFAVKKSLFPPIFHLQPGGLDLYIRGGIQSLCFFGLIAEYSDETGSVIPV